MNIEIEKYFNKDNLISMISYGMEPEDVFSSTLVAIMQSVDVDSIEKTRKLKHKDVVIMSEEEFFNSSDVFPIEFITMRYSYRIVYGEDILSKVKINTENYRHQLEYEIRSKKQILTRAIREFGKSSRYTAKIMDDLVHQLKILIIHTAHLSQELKTFEYDYMVAIHRISEVSGKKMETLTNLLYSIEQGKYKKYSKGQKLQFLSDLLQDLKDLQRYVDSFEA